MPDIITQLKALKLHGMADSYAELVSQGAHGATASLESSETATGLKVFGSARRHKRSSPPDWASANAPARTATSVNRIGLLTYAIPPSVPAGENTLPK